MIPQVLLTQLKPVIDKRKIDVKYVPTNGNNEQFVLKKRENEFYFQIDAADRDVQNIDFCDIGVTVEVPKTSKEGDLTIEENGV